MGSSREKARSVVRVSVGDLFGLTLEQANALRRSFFASAAGASAVVSAFDVSVERVAEQIAESRRWRVRPTLDVASLSVPDLAHAAACVDGADGAWSRLINDYEESLILATEPFEGRTLAVISVRRFFIELRKVNQRNARSSLNLRRYSGSPMLRNWLSERLLVKVGLRPTRSRDLLVETPDSEMDRLDLALEMLRNERDVVERISSILASERRNLDRVVGGSELDELSAPIDDSIDSSRS